MAVKKLKIYIYWVVVALYLGLIFYFSGQNGETSHKVSSGLLHYISYAALLFPEGFVDFFYSSFKNHELFLRKLAHFTEYLILAIIFYKALMVSNVKVKKSYIITLGFCFFYAVTDEVHQIFVPGRAFGIKDILIDTLGATLGLIIIRVRKLKKR
jgi:VanZ family protein